MIIPMRLARSCILFLPLACLAAGLAHGAVDPDGAGAAIEGRVIRGGPPRDGSGVAGAGVSLMRDGGIVASAVADGTGSFHIGPVPAGRYELEVSAAGLERRRVANLAVRRRRVRRLVVALKPAADGKERLLKDGDTSTRSRYEAPFIEGLPILGHNYQDVLTLAPGVSDPDGDGNPNIHGARADEVRYRLDRVDITDPLSGGSGMNLSPLTLEAVEVITAGAPAGFGLAGGGFANITTRSGGNDFAGAVQWWWRGRALDGDRQVLSDVTTFHFDPVNWHDARVGASAGGPFVKDRLWYFGSLESLNSGQPTGELGAGELVTTRGVWYFGKLTGQAGPSHKIGLQVAGDPMQVDNLGLTSLTAAGSGYGRDQGAVAAGLTWTATLSPDLLLESAITVFHGDAGIEPESDRFAPTGTVTVSAGVGLSAVYPCSVVNCNDAMGEKDVYQVHLTTGRISGPFYFKNEDEHARTSLRTDLSWVQRGAVEEHRLQGGFELETGSVRRAEVVNPILFDLTTPYFLAPPGTNAISGVQILQTVQGMLDEREVTTFDTGLYLQDSWKPRPNLAVNAGLRFDERSLDAGGYRPFDPRAERRRSVVLWRDVCAEAVRQGVPMQSNSNCRFAATYDGSPPSGLPSDVLKSFLDANNDGVNDVPSDVAALDLNGNGTISLTGLEGAALFKYLTTNAGRQSENFSIEDAHVSPRVGVSWDPWSDGRTRLFAHWGRYYDRVRPDAALVDSEGASISYSFTPDANHVILPGALSRAATLPSIAQVDHGLRTPRTDEISLGVERSLGAVWTAGLTWIGRHADDLLQDVDLNHFTCGQSDSVMGIDPMAVCGDAGKLDKDRFGALGFSSGGFVVSFPNGIEDLYVANTGFNRILRVVNANTSRYTAMELTLRRALHRNWQLDASYTWSRARGQAESAFSSVGDDPTNRRAEDGWLGFDQRHQLKFHAVAHLPHDVVFGSAVRWASGVPYSIVLQVPADGDSAGNFNARTLYPLGQRNDARNGAIWTIDGRVEKGFTMGRVRAAGFLDVADLLNHDDLVFTTVDVDGNILEASREPGRRFEIGARVDF